jgi:hypothetical protein
MIFLVIFLLAFAFWAYAEKKLGIAARISAGLACMVFIGFSFYFVAGIIPSYERTFVRSSLRRSGELLSTGETQRVEQAITAYNGLAVTNSYRASMEMWEILSHDTNK